MLTLKNKRALVVGMAKSGMGAARLLMRQGARVVCYDAKSLDALSPDISKFITDNGLMLVGDENVDSVWRDCDLFVLSPGVPEMRLGFISSAYERNKRVMPEIELGYLCSKADFVAVSGTNGKTTTTALTGEIFKNAGKNTYVLGNIGTPVTDYALETKPGDVVVIEAAAFQLNPAVEFHPKAAAVLNVTEDHLERFITMEAYAAAKANIFKNQTKDDFCVLNADNEYTVKMAGGVKSRVLWFSRRREVDCGAFLSGNDIIYRFGGVDKYICNRAQVYIPGEHNLENALAACCLASCMGVSAQVIRHTFMNFKGVEHRIEFVRELEGVRYINDSKATNPDATMRAIDAMKNPTVLILGGYDKLNDFTQLFGKIMQSGLIKDIVVVGATKRKIIEAAKAAGYANTHEADTFDEAVQMARSLAREGYNVLLSPACASYDMFDDYEQRGRVFKEITRFGK